MDNENQLGSVPVEISNDEPVDWVATTAKTSRGGGQGTVVQVRHRHDGTLGACKTLHPQHLKSKERRFRMQQEVFLLNLLEGNGVPRVLWDNMNLWEASGTPLYAVVEWVDGGTLADFCNGQPKSIDVAVRIVWGLLGTVRRCHTAGVLHRDIKPDNVILRNGDIDAPVLIDFGMGWAEVDEDRFGEFKTGDGQELGNRFIRLPEYAPGHHVRDTRSDVTMLVAILFYLLTGVAPRQLLDPKERMPHEGDLARFPDGTTSDPRWERLCRIFKVGFQYRIDMRFRDAQELAHALESIFAPIETPMNDPLEGPLKRIAELTESADGVLLGQCQRHSLDALKLFFDRFHTRIGEFGFQAGGQGPVVEEWGRAVKTTLFLSKVGVAEPKVGFVHQISFENGRFEGAYSVVGDALWHGLYRTPLADTDSLAEAAEKSVDTILSALLDRYADALGAHVARMSPT
ncbi:serine/threonine protein kinase [Ralstonia pickettii]|uniref:serine/threonine protein kinase n=1 Tax=Ralstonia pickettii TaxID=329 RepID=UPI0015C086D7|nr:hypothetical protein [Ralstonia pickettii]NWK43323.1 hypothetical protein [Ralstonia pickettii]